ncbi:cytochrome P450 [Marinactinospora endophytica]
MAPVEVAPGLDGWLLLDYHESLTALRDSALFSTDPRHWKGGDGQGQAPPPVAPRIGAPPGDGPRHRRLRAPLGDTVAALSGQRAARGVREIAHGLIDGFASTGRADLVGDYAVPLTGRALGGLFGLSGVTGETLVDLLAQTYGGDGRAGRVAAERIRAYLSALVASRRAGPGGDLVSRLLSHPAGLDGAETADALALLLDTGYESTVHLIGNVLRVLLSDAEVASAYRGATLPAGDLIDHVMWVAPPLRVSTGRFPRRDLRIGDARIREGEAVLIGFAAAHTDPAVGGRADGRRCVSDLAGNRAHLMWGAGPHGCPARGLARDIAVTAVDTLLDRLALPRLAIDPQRLRPHPSPSAHGCAELPVLFRPEAPKVAPPPSAGRRRALRFLRPPRSTGARYQAPGARTGDDPAQPEPASTPPRAGRPRPTGARYHVPAPTGEHPPQDPLEALVRCWRPEEDSP